MEGLSEIQPKKTWWKRPKFWIISLVVLAIAAAPLVFYFVWQKNTASSGAASAPSGNPVPVDYIQAIDFSPDGRLVAAAIDDYDIDGNLTDSSIILWDVASGHKLHTFSAQGDVTSLAFGPDGQVLAVGAENANITLLNVASGRALSTHFSDSSGVHSLAFSPNGQMLAAGGDAGIARLWNTSRGLLVKAFPGAANAGNNTSVAFSLDGRLLAVGSTTLVVWNTGTGHAAYLFPDTKSIVDITSLAFSPDGRALAFSSEVTSSDGGGAQTITLWNLGGGKKPRTLVSQDAASFIYAISFSPDGGTLAATSDPGVILRWNVATGKKLPDIQGTNELVLSYDPGGRVLASGGADQVSSSDQQAYIELWDANNGKQLRILN